MSAYVTNAAIAPPTEQQRELTADPEKVRKMSLNGEHPGIRQRLWGFESRLDPTVTFEEYTFWADIEREMEKVEHQRFKASQPRVPGKGLFKSFLRADAYEDGAHADAGSPQLEGAEEVHTKNEDGTVSAIAPRSETHDYDAEWRQASRALRTASWGGIFYLITTDILGWGQTPYVFANTGYGLGVGIFALMGLAAGASGFMIWRVFLRLDSARYPVLSFGDPFFRLFGPKSRHFINVLQAIQMFLSVAVLQLGQTNVLAQLSESSDLCYIVIGLIILIVGMVSGYLRALKHLGWLCNAAVWLNVCSFIIVCVAAAKFGPDPTAQVTGGILPKEWQYNPAPVRTFIDAPPAEYQPTDSNLFAAKFNGINSMVYAYSGAVLFIAFMAEMRHPWDFWKAMFCAQTFISVVYIFFGAFCYAYYGQYAYSVITQVVKPLGLQIVSNILTLITGWLAIFLYFNIGMKTVYLEIGQQLFGLAPISTRRGKFTWWALGPFYWILAFIVAMSVPQFNAFTNFVGGLFSLNFTYSFSGMMFLGYKIQDSARLPGEGFDPVTGVTTRFDNGMKRWIRGFTKSWYWTVPVLVYTCAGLAASGMGSWAAILALEAAFAPTGSSFTSWSCKNPFRSG